jgi:hypothetical protein
MIQISFRKSFIRFIIVLLAFVGISCINTVEKVTGQGGEYYCGFEVVGYYPYYEIVNRYGPEPWVDEVDRICFNGVETIRRKTDFVFDNDYGGVMFWEITQDTRDESSLLFAISDEILLNSGPDFNCDTAVNSFDLNYIVGKILSKDCSSVNFWCERVDLNQSGKVDLIDYAEFADYWAGCSQQL